MQYFIKRGEKVQGPFSREQLLVLAKAKKITAADLVSNSAQGPFQELKSVWESIKNPPAAPAIPEPVTQTTEPVPASPPVPAPVVQERFETPVIETGGSPTAQPEPQSVPSSLPMSAKPNGRKKLLLIGGIAGGVVLLLTIITVVVVMNSGSGSESRQMTLGNRLVTEQGIMPDDPTEAIGADAPSFEYNEAEKTFLSIVEQINQSNDDHRKAGDDSNAARKAKKLAELEGQRELLITNANKTMETLMQPFREQPMKFTVERVYSESSWYGRVYRVSNDGDEANVSVTLLADVLWLECKRGGLTYRFGVCPGENERYEQFRDTIAELNKGDKVSGTFDLLARRPVKDDIVFATEFRDFRNYGDCISNANIEIGLFQRHMFIGTDAEPIIELTPGQGAFGIAPLP